MFQHLPITEYTMSAIQGNARYGRVHCVNCSHYGIQRQMREFEGVSCFTMNFQRKHIQEANSIKIKFL